MFNLLAVFIGGGIGAACRYILTVFAGKYFGLTHWGTFLVNIIGCFFIGYIFGLTINKIDLINPYLKLFLTVGFLGGLTTFSAFSCEAFCLLKDGKVASCAIYMFISFAAGLLATFSGYLISK